jgi:hypothetical protein
VVGLQAGHPQSADTPRPQTRYRTRSHTALIRLVGAVLAEQHDEAESRRYLGLDVLSRSRAGQTSPTEQEAIPVALTA